MAGLNLVNFSLGVIIGVGIPFLTAYLKGHRWTFQNVGIATAMVGFGTLAFQALSGLIAEKFPRHRLLMGGAIATYGASFSLLPLVIGTSNSKFENLILL